MATWALDAVRFFRPRGFFASAAEADTELAERIHVETIQEWGELPEMPNAVSRDMHALWRDPERIWCQDLEVAGPEERAYECILREWERISRGVLRIGRVAEYWSPSYTARIELEISWGTSLRVSDPSAAASLTFDHGSGDYVDTAITRLLNQAIAASGFRIEVAACGGFDANYVLVLRPDERREIERRGWRFLW